MTPPTVLVADDDRSIRTVLTQALGRSGYQVRSTGNAATLWRWVEDGEGDLVITDVVMPDENGLDLIPRIRKLRPGPARRRDERSVHADDSGQGGPARRLRIPAQAVRFAGTAVCCRTRAGGVAGAIGHRSRTARCGRAAAADRTQSGDAGDLPDGRAAHHGRPDGDDQWRVGHREGIGRARAA